MSKPVEFPEDEDIEETLDKIKIGGKTYDVEIGPKGGRFITVDGKKRYESDYKYKQDRAKPKETRKKPSKFVPSKYKDHPLTNMVKSIMNFSNIIVNNTILSKKKKLTSKDVDNSQVGESLTYCADSYGWLGDVTSPALILLFSIGGYLGRIGVLYMEGETKEIKQTKMEKLGTGDLIPT